MFNIKKFFCCCLGIYDKYEREKIKKIYDECFTEEF